MKLRQGNQRIQRLPVHQPEIRAAGERLCIADFVQNLIESLAGPFFEGGFAFLFDALSQNNIISAVCQADHLRNQFWRMLSVSVHGNSVVTFCMLQTSRKGCLMSEIPAEMKGVNSWVFRGKLI